MSKGRNDITTLASYDRQLDNFKSRSHCHELGHDSPRITVDVIIVVSRDYLTPIKPSYEYLRSFYGEATNINDICTILKQIHHDCTTISEALVWSHELVRF